MLKRARRGRGGRRRRAGRVVSLAGAVAMSALLLGVLGFGYGTVPSAAAAARVPGNGGAGGASTRSDSSAAVTEAVASVLDQLSQLRPNQVHRYPDSNAWAANGPAVAGASAGQPRALLGGDPHLPQTLPSIWYEVALSAPGYRAAGVTVPGLPGLQTLAGAWLARAVIPRRR